jgi:hypothetical protein
LPEKHNPVKAVERYPLRTFAVVQFIIHSAEHAVEHGSDSEKSDLDRPTGDPMSRFNAVAHNVGQKWLASTINRDSSGQDSAKKRAVGKNQR